MQEIIPDPAIEDFAIRCLLLSYKVEHILQQESNRVVVSVLVEAIREIICEAEDFEGAKQQVVNFFRGIQKDE